MCFRFFYFCLVNFLSLVSLDAKTKPSIPQGKIVGGRPVSLTRFPSAVLFYNMGAQCAGSVINSWTVLTAGHCFDINKDTTNMVVEVGARYIYDFQSKAHEVDSFVVHEKYNMTALFSCDIALIFLKKPIKFNKKVKKAILVNNNEWMNSREKHFNAIGWGWTAYGGSLSKDGLMATELDFVTSKECGRMHKLKLSPDMFCLYGHGSKDTCRGDSGGGIWWKHMIVGITSHGDGCAQKNKPSVYANVWYFRKWIEEHVQNFIATSCIALENNSPDDS